MKSSFACALILSCCAAFGQQAAGTLAFEVASIKLSEPQQMGRIRIMMNTDGGMLRYSNVSLKDCVRNAFRVKEFQIEGPEWMGNQRFDIVAKFPEGATEKQVPEMLQALLTERFKLTVHRNTKEGAIYALVAGKNGPKLKPAETTAPAAAPDAKTPGGAPPRGGVMMSMGPEGAHLKAPSVTVSGLAEMISRFAERPVVDMTGIEGQYDFDLVFTPETMRGMPGGGRGPMGGPGAGGPPPGGGAPPSDIPVERAGSIYDSVQQYGLKLEPRKAPMEMLVVDHIEKTPTEN
ncbi:TIGR03435 family protein [Paludibaculum fermentans]|uniref:TIGR03435 family protein n=1 Tax=Paludibaculum fermentans TaxID=1473598 RepID=A0A7S7NRF9_PALFE|nr:TIGR03435 family protein [Paludibaculum fermentans]QOY88354.1 TIGR03435 family protein [Paludibaculum fermentans]